MEIRVSKSLILVIFNFFNNFKNLNLSKKVEYGNLEIISTILDLASNSTPFLESINEKVNSDSEELKIIKDFFNSYLKYFQSDSKDKLTEFLDDVFYIVCSNFEFNISEKDIENFLFSIYDYSKNKDKVDLYNLVLKYIKNDEIYFFRYPLDFISKKIDYLLLYHTTNNILSLDPNIFKTSLVYIPAVISEIQENINLISMKNDINIFTEDFEKLLSLLRTIHASRIARKKAELYEPIYSKLHEVWDKEGWSQLGRGKYKKFAEYIIENEKYFKVYLAFDTIKEHISKYDKNNL